MGEWCVGRIDRWEPDDCKGWCYAPSVACDKCNGQVAIEDANEVYFEVRDNTVFAEFTCANGCNWHACAASCVECDELSLREAWWCWNIILTPGDPNPCSREG